MRKVRALAAAPEKIQRSIYFEIPTHDKLVVMSRNERRHFSQMVHVLIEEAIDARKEKELAKVS